MAFVIGFGFSDDDTLELLHENGSELHVVLHLAPDAQQLLELALDDLLDLLETFEEVNVERISAQ